MKQQYCDYAVEQLKKVLSIPSPSGFTEMVAGYLMAEFKALGYQPQQTQKGGVLVDLGGEDADNAILLGCHVDTLGGMVARVKENGRLRLTPLGGLEPNNTETENVTVFTRDGRTYSGTFQMENASVHVNKEYKTASRGFDNMEVVLDENTASAEETKALGIGTGDIVCFDPRTVITPNGFIKSRFLDDKLSSAILLALAKYRKEEDAVSKRKVYLHFTVFEEVGHGGSASIPQGVTEFLAVDMGCVGEGLACDETMVSICAKDSSGPSSYQVVSGLIDAAKEGGVSYAVDVYPFYSSDADVAIRSGRDLRHCVVGAGVYASHGYERSHIDGIKNTFNLLKAYIYNK